MPGFTTPDPLAEKHYSESPYSYCGGDPVNRMDPLWLDWYDTSDHQYIICANASDKTKCIDNDGRHYCWSGAFYSVKNAIGSFVCTPDCGIYREQDFKVMIINQQTGNTTPQNLLKDKLAFQIKITGNISELNKINYWDPSNTIYYAITQHPNLLKIIF